MLIDVNNLTVGDSLEVMFADVVEVPVVDGKSKADVNVKGTLTHIGNEYIFKGKVTAVLSLNCDLCLNTYNTKLTRDMYEIYSKESNSEKEIWNFSEKTIDLKPAVITNILLSMPMKAVCSDDCKGLCPICGHNLNESDCGCETGNINPVFEKLKNLFDDKEV